MLDHVQSEGGGQLLVRTIHRYAITTAEFIPPILWSLMRQLLLSTLTCSVHEQSITIRVTTTVQTECQRWQHMQNGYQLIVCEVSVRGEYRNTRRNASWVGENVEHSKLTLFLHAVWAVHCLVHTRGPSCEPSGVSARRAYKRRGIVSDSNSCHKQRTRKWSS